MNYELVAEGQGCRGGSGDRKSLAINVANGEDPEACAKLVKAEATCVEYFNYMISGYRAGYCDCIVSAAAGGTNAECTDRGNTGSYNIYRLVND